MKIIAVANQKGGVAKTTSTFNIAYMKAKQGKRVLMVDLDPQASLTISCGFEPGGDNFNGGGITSLLDGSDALDCAFTVDTTGLKNLYLIPSDITLAEVEMKLFTKTNRERKLRKTLSALDAYFDYCFIDCPPQLGLLTINALMAANEVLIPCKTDYLSYRGLKALISTIKEFQSDSELNPNLKLVGIVATMYEKLVTDQRDVLELMEKLAPVIGVVKKAANTSKDVYLGKPVTLSRPKSEPAIAYMDIANKI